MESIRSFAYLVYLHFGILEIPGSSKLLLLFSFSLFFTLVSIVVQVKLESKLFIYLFIFFVISIIIICALSVLISVSFQIRAIELTILTLYAFFI